MKKEHIILQLISNTNVRLHELMSLKVEDFDPEAMTLKIRNKTGTKLLPVTKELNDLLQSYINNHKSNEPLF